MKESPAVLFPSLAHFMNHFWLPILWQHTYKLWVTQLRWEGGGWVAHRPPWVGRGNRFTFERLVTDADKQRMQERNEKEPTSRAGRDKQELEEVECEQKGCPSPLDFLQLAPLLFCCCFTGKLPAATIKEKIEHIVHHRLVLWVLNCPKHLFFAVHCNTELGHLKKLI